MNPIDHFLERNYIDPIVLKYTKFNPTRKREGTFKCGGNCGGWFKKEDMQAIIYSSGKRIWRCESCMNKYRQRGIR